MLSKLTRDQPRQSLNAYLSLTGGNLNLLNLPGQLLNLTKTKLNAPFTLIEIFLLKQSSQRLDFRSPSMVGLFSTKGGNYDISDNSISYKYYAMG